MKRKDHPKDSKKLKDTLSVVTVSSILILSFILFSFLAPLTTATDPDYEKTFDLDTDGNNTTYYTAIRKNDANNASIHLKAWDSNRTIEADFTNIKSIELNISETDINTESFERWLFGFGGKYTLKLSSNTDNMDFTFRSIPEFAGAELDDEDWDDYEYNETTETLDFSLPMSDHTIELLYSGAIGQFLAILLSFLVIKFAFSSFLNMDTDSGGSSYD